MPVEGDRRAMVVRLTRKGHEDFSELAEMHEKWIDGLLGSVDIDKIEQLLELFDGIPKEGNHGKGAGK